MEPRGLEWDLVRFLRFECLKVSGICWMLAGDCGVWFLSRFFLFCFLLFCDISGMAWLGWSRGSLTSRFLYTIVWL